MTAHMLYRCQKCRKVSAGRKPKGGDGSFMYPRRHKDRDGAVCRGCFREAAWLDGGMVELERIHKKGEG